MASKISRSHSPNKSIMHAMIALALFSFVVVYLGFMGKVTMSDVNMRIPQKNQYAAEQLNLWQHNRLHPKVHESSGKSQTNLTDTNTEPTSVNAADGQTVPIPISVLPSPLAESPSPSINMLKNKVGIQTRSSETLPQKPEKITKPTSGEASGQTLSTPVTMSVLATTGQSLPLPPTNSVMNQVKVVNTRRGSEIQFQNQEGSDDQDFVDEFSSRGVSEEASSVMGKVPVMAVPNLSSPSSSLSKSHSLSSSLHSKNLSFALSSRTRSPAVHLGNISNASLSALKFFKKGEWIGRGGRVVHDFDEKLAEALVMFLRKENATSVLELGRGMGRYAEALTSDGALITCYDDNPNTHKLSGGHCAVMDLSRVVNVTPHDWVLCLQVGEHIPARFEEQFLKNVVSGSKKGIVLSWAPEGYDGLGHVNNLNNSYIRQKLAALGFQSDLKVEQQLRNRSKFVYFKKAIMVFRKKKQGGSI